MCYHDKLVPPPLCCGWCGHPVFTAVGPFLFDQGCPGGPLSAADPGGPVGPLHNLFGPLLDGPGRSLALCPLNLPVLWEALLRGWLVCGGCDGP